MLWSTCLSLECILSRQLQAKRGELDAVVTSATKLSKAQMAKVTDVLKATAKGKAVSITSQVQARSPPQSPRAVSHAARAVWLLSSMLVCSRFPHAPLPPDRSTSPFWAD